jgi:peptide/nickel transport system substrate-binding protein
LITALTENGIPYTTDSEGDLSTVNGKSLEYTFTIAGDTTDHPACQMFMKAKETLEEIGFTITVNTDIKALTKLSTGQLAVWAAAWSSTVDPDLYQVYHKDSKATSIKNWGYAEIFKDADQFGYEQRKINQLSELIEEARTKLDEESRKKDYAEALDLIMDLAVELPTYQRNDCLVYNKDLIDSKTLNKNPTANTGVIDKMWELNYN